MNEGTPVTVSTTPTTILTTPTTPSPTTPTTSGVIPTANGSDWTSGLSDDLRGYAQNKGFKDPGAVVDSYRNFEKLMGAPKERLLTLPEKSEDPAWGEVYNRLGRPLKPEEYQLSVPEGDSGEFAKAASSWFHEQGLSKKQAQGVVNKYNEHLAKQSEAQATQQKAQIEADDLALKKESGFGNILSPEAAKNRINTLRSDPDFTRRYIEGETAAKEEFENLHKWAHPDSA
jgi:hypothetical protein